MTADLLAGKRLAVLGTGKIGSLLLRAFLAQKLITADRLRATVRRPERAQALTQDLGAAASTDNRAATRDADIVLLCVKPQTVTEVLEAIRPELGPAKLVISVAASASRRRLGNDSASLVKAKAA